MKHFNIYRTIIVSGLLACTIVTGANAASHSVTLLKGKEYPICREFNKILQSSANKTIIYEKSNLPEKDSFFRLPDAGSISVIPWKSLTQEEIDSEKYRNVNILAEAKRVKQYATTHSSKLFGYKNKSIRYQTAFLDYDFDGTKEIINRYVMPWNQMNGRCFFPDNAPERFHNQPNTPEFCNFITHNGRIYLVNTGADIVISELSKVRRQNANGPYDTIYKVDICRYR